MSATVTVVGLKEANRAIKALPREATGEVQHTMDATAFQVARAASSDAPRSMDGSYGHPSGFLASSIKWDPRPRSLQAVVTVAKAAFYWKFVEFGTRKWKGKSFLRPAADRFREDHRRNLQAALDRAGTAIEKLGYRG